MLATLLVVGCKGPSPQDNPFTATGFMGVLIDAEGKPLADVRVKLVPDGEVDGYVGQPADAVTNSKGRFEPLTQGVTRVHYGRYKVILEPARPELDEQADLKSRVPARYRSEQTTDLFLTVSKTSPRVVALILKPE